MSNSGSDAPCASNSTDYNEERFAPPVGTRLPQHWRRRTEATQLDIRQPRLIAKPSDLSDREVNCLRDLVEEWMMTRPLLDEENIKIPNKLFQKILERIFECWTSAQTANPLPQLKAWKAEDIGIKVGVLSQNHPPPKAKSDDARGETWPSHMTGADVFLSPTLQYGEENIRWM